MLVDAATGRLVPKDRWRMACVAPVSRIATNASGKCVGSTRRVTCTTAFDAAAR
jgi:hypothetical protein